MEQMIRQVGANSMRCSEAYE